MLNNIEIDLNQFLIYGHAVIFKNPTRVISAISFNSDSDRLYFELQLASVN